MRWVVRLLHDFPEPLRDNCPITEFLHILLGSWRSEEKAQKVEASTHQFLGDESIPLWLLLEQHFHPSLFDTVLRQLVLIDIDINYSYYHLLVSALSTLSSVAIISLKACHITRRSLVWFISSTIHTTITQPPRIPRPHTFARPCAPISDSNPRRRLSNSLLHPGLSAQVVRAAGCD